MVKARLNNNIISTNLCPNEPAALYEPRHLVLL